MALGALPSIRSHVVVAADFSSNEADVEGVLAIASYELYVASLSVNEEYEFYGVETSHLGVETETLIWRDTVLSALLRSSFDFKGAAIRVPGRLLRIKAITGTPTNPTFVSLGIILGPTDVSRRAGFSGSASL